MPATIHTNLGDLIALFYADFLEAFGDEELASVATAAAIQDLLTDSATTEVEPLCYEAAA
jgi:hypothetical protein